MAKEIDRIPIIHNGTLYTIPIINPEDIPKITRRRDKKWKKKNNITP